MAVTKQTYTATATWTASQLADIFRSAFIDAGLMTDWHDTFLSGSIENRVLRVQYDSAKTYGTTFYWFQFSTAGAYVQIATGWNTSTDVPTGTQYLDYVTTTTNAANGWNFGVAVTSSTCELVRYTSGADANQSWFVFRNGANRRVFTITDESSTLESWLDLNKGCYGGFYHTACNTGTSRPYGNVRFLRGPALRRDLVLGTALNGVTSAASYNSGSADIAISGYGTVGNLSNSFSANAEAGFSASSASGGANERNAGVILLPCGFTGTNPAFTTNSNPVFSSMPFQPYTVNALPSDFGLTFHFATNTFSPGDTFVVSSGVEEWEVLDFNANASSVTGASPLFLARTV